MATALASEVRHIQQVSGLSARDIAKATNVDESTVRSWLRQDRSPSGERADRLVELSAMVERLSNLLDRDYIAVWMNKPIPSLEDDKPLEVIAAGEYRRVSRVIASLEDPGAS
ncbi:MAG: helix-turn-helix domain-containing protein [Actinomycetes bacterium]